MTDVERITLIIQLVALWERVDRLDRRMGAQLQACIDHLMEVFATEPSTGDRLHLGEPPR